VTAPRELDQVGVCAKFDACSADFSLTGIQPIGDGVEVIAGLDTRLISAWRQ